MSNNRPKIIGYSLGLSVFFILQFCFLVFISQTAFAKEATAKHELSQLKVFNRAVLLVKEQYVEPDRFNPREMLLAALEAVEKRVPEIVISEPQNDVVIVQVSDKKKEFSVSDLTSLWDLSFRLRDIFQFVEVNLPKSVKTADVEYAAVNGMLSKLDPHSILLEPKVSSEMKLTTKGEFGGLGIVISLRDGYLTVISPIEGTPAYKAGLMPFDRITKINDESTINLALDEAVEKLRGAPGTLIALTILRKGETNPRVVKMTRQIIKVDSIQSQLIDNNVGYVKVKAFQANTAQDMKRVIDNMKKQTKGNLKGLILDFRNNPGGLLEQSIAVSDLFLDGGVVVATQGSTAQNRQEENATRGPEKTKLPIVVLVNGGSASASEIVAGAIKNRGRGLVIGQQTFGKGSVQLLYDFPDKSALKLTIAQYLTPGNESIQSVGITPDIIVEPVFADSKEETDLFPSAKMREEDLDLHLNDKRTVVHKPSFELKYLSKKPSKEELERQAVSQSYKEDFEIRFAKRLLLGAKGPSRDQLLQSATNVVRTVGQEEKSKIKVALQKLGVDWTEPLAKAATPKLVPKLLMSPVAKAGEPLKIMLEVTNSGTLPAWQVYGLSESATSIFAGEGFLYGKINPGEKRTWTLSIPVPKDAISRRDMMRVGLFANGAIKVGSIDVPLVIQGLDKPVFAHQVEFINKEGAKLSTLPEGETIDVRVSLKNIGKGTAEEPMVFLKNLGGAEIFIEEGRQTLKPLKPGESRVVTLRLTAKKAGLPAQLRLQLFDGVSGDYWAEKIELPVQAQVNGGNFTSPQALKATESYRLPPQISLAPEAVKPIVAGEQYKLYIKVTDDTPIKDAFLYVNDTKVYYQSFENKNKKDIDLLRDVKLKPGVNSVTMVVREDEDYDSRETITIFSTVGNPIEEKSAAGQPKLADSHK